MQLIKQLISSRLFFRSIIVLSSLYFVYLIVGSINGEPLWFADSLDYKGQSDRDLFSMGFLCPERIMWFNPRPITFPLLYKMVGSEPHRMMLFQKVLYSLSVLIFIFSINLFQKNKISKIITCLILLYYFTWWNIVGWTTCILSESISMSFMILWFAAILLYYHYRNGLTILLLIPITFLLSFTRDTWPYIIVAFFLMNLFICPSAKKRIKINSVLFLFSIALFLIQSYTVKVGKRSATPVFNSIAGRVAQNDEYLAWFKKEGMPRGEQLVKDFRGLSLETDQGIGRVYTRYLDTTYSRLYEWIGNNGANVYQKFVLMHPSYFFLADQSKAQISRIFTYNVPTYYRPPEKFFLNGDNFLPVFNYYYTLVLVLILAYLWFKYKKIIYIFPAVLTLLTILNALISYNADTLEVKRHEVGTVINLELISVLASIWLIIYLLRLITVKMKRRSRLQMV